MDIYVPWSDYNKIQNGYAVYHAAFESGNTGRLGNLTDSDYYQTIGYPDVWPGTPNTYLYSISDSQIRGLMSDLDPDSDEERFVYMRCQENIRNVDLSEQVELRIDARAKQGDTWGRGIRNENQVTVTEGDNYTYRLTVASKQDSQTGGILIYDAIEAYVPHEGYDQDDVNGKKAWSGDWQDKGQWKGRLISVDLSELYDPKQIWHQRSSYYADGEVMAEGYGGMTFSVPDKVSESSAWHWEEAEDGQYVIINDASIDAAYQLSVQCTITGIRASKIVDMLPSDPLKATVEVTNRSGVKDTMSTQELTAVIDTREKLSDTGAGISGTVYSSPENVPESMKENLPGGSRNANNYVYVCWRTWPLYEGTQYFSLDLDLWAGLAEGNGTSIAGIILGEGGNVSGGTVGTETSGDQAGEHYSRQTLKYNFDTNGTNDTHSRNIWVAYPTAQMQGNKTYTIHAASQWTLTEADPKRESDSKEESCADAAASVSYTHSGWEYPAGLFGVYEYSGSQPGHTHSTTIKDRPEGSTSTLGHKKDKTYEMAIGALRNNKSVTLEYEVLTTGYGYSYTAGPTSEVP